MLGWEEWYARPKPPLPPGLNGQLLRCAIHSEEWPVELATMVSRAREKSGDWSVFDALSNYRVGEESPYNPFSHPDYPLWKFPGTESLYLLKRSNC